ncbi:MAG: hypothetical protein ACRC6I_18185 [Paracoccaceae bacterium]
MADIYVDAIDGLDTNTGLSASLPVKTIELAAFKAISLPKSDDAVVSIKGFSDPLISYNLAAPVYLTEGGNRTDVGKRLRFEAMDGPAPLITARTRVQSWSDDSTTIISTPMAGNEISLWSDQFPLQRASWGKDTPAFKVFQWEPATKSVLVFDGICPAGGATTGLLFCVQMGWSLSQLRVTTIQTNAVVGYSRVSFAVEKDVEFAKSDGGMGLPFPIGPYHAAPNFQHFWWENAAEFLPYAFGNFFHDTVAGRMRVRTPIGATSALFNSTGVWKSNGNSTAFYTTSTADGLYSEQVDFKGIAFKHFGWNWPASNGFVGYISGYSLYKNGSSVGYEKMPGVLEFARAKSVSIEDCFFSDITGVAVFGLYGCIGFRIEKSGFKRIGSSAICFKGVVSPFDDMTPANQNNGLLIKDCYIETIGFAWSGSAIFTGQWFNYEIYNCTIKDCADDAIGLGDGARVKVTWTGLVSRVMWCDIDGAMKRTRDGGAIYTSGNQTMLRRLALSPPRADHPQLVIALNRIRNVFESNLTDESPGNRCADIYLDLGTSQVAVYGNLLENGDLAFLENCAPFNRFFDNKLVNIVQEKYTAYSGFNDTSDTGGPYTAKLYQPPLNNPCNADDVHRFNGTGPYAGAGFGAFKDVCPFPSPEACFIDSTTSYATLSLFLNNGPSTIVNMAGVGASDAVISKFGAM